MRLPPLNALRAFEAAARHGGYVAASEELNVTRGAVSRHVKILEQHIGVPLFDRQAQGVRLTNAGRELQQVLEEAFQRIATGTKRVQADANDLRIICPPDTSIRWLVPRLGAFRQKHPDIRVRLTTDFHRITGYDSKEYDLGFSVENWPNRSAEVETTKLFPVRLTPACSPKLLANRGALSGPEDISHFDILHESSHRFHWGKWIETFSPDGLDASSGQDFPNLDMATRAALLGAGFVMLDLFLCREEIESGTLIAPFPDMVCEGPFGYVSLLGRFERRQEPKIKAFREWAAETAAQVEFN